MQVEQTVTKSFEGWPLWAPLVLVIFGIAAIQIILHFVYKGSYQKLLQQNRRWAAAIIKTLSRPFVVFLWFLGLIVLAGLYAHYFLHFSQIHVITKILKVGLVLAIGWALIIFAKEAERMMLLKKNVDQTSIEIFGKLSSLLIGVIILLMALPIFGVEVGGLLAFGGFSAIAVGFAAREIISNLLGSFIIAIDKPFRIGDWIYTTDTKMEGIVEHIGWRLTTIRTFDKRPLYIPNSMFSSLSFVNASRMTHRRIQTTLRVRYCDIEKIEEIIRELNRQILSDPDLDTSQLNYISFDNFDDSGLDIVVRLYTKTVNKLEFQIVQQNILLKCARIVRDMGGDLAYPTSVVYLRRNNEEKTHAFS